MQPTSFLVFFTLLLILSISSALADSEVDLSIQSGVSADSHMLVSPESSQELAVLRAQLDAARDFNSAILNTVYWALGGTFVLAGLLLGFGWLANFKVYERDKNAMKSELDGAIVSRMAELEASINEKLSDLPNLVRISTNEVTTNMLKSHSEAVNSVSGRVFNFELRYLKEKMRANSSLNMALTDALRLFEMCSKSAADEVPDIMHFMIGTIDKGGKLTAIEITSLNKLLDTLPSHYGTLTEKLRAKLVASDIF